MKNKYDDKYPMLAQCHLWKKQELSDQDLTDAFEILHTFLDDPHIIHQLVKCRECGQLFFREMYEEIDWADGEDPVFRTYIPVRNRKEAELLNRKSRFELQTFLPRLNEDWPKGGPKKIYWMNRELTQDDKSPFNSEKVGLDNGLTPGQIEAIRKADAFSQAMVDALNKAKANGEEVW